jgi:hypothetical protein
LPDQRSERRRGLWWWGENPLRAAKTLLFCISIPEQSNQTALKPRIALNAQIHAEKQ